MSPRPRTGVILLVMGTAALAAAAITSSWTTPLTGDLFFWALLALAAELMWIRLPLGGATISMASCPQFAMLLILPPAQAMLLTAATGGVAEALVLRKPLLRVLFNASQNALAVGGAAWLFAHTGGGAKPLPELIAQGALLPFALAACAYFAVNTAAVSGAVALSEGLPVVAAWRRNFGDRHETFASAALLSLGVLLASQAVAIGMAGTVLIALPVALAYNGYRLAARLHAREQEPEGPRKAA